MDISWNQEISNYEAIWRLVLPTLQSQPVEKQRWLYLLTYEENWEKDV